MSGNIPLTKNDLNSATAEIMKHVTRGFGHERTMSKEELGKVKDEIKEEIDKVHVELDAIKEMLTYRKELRNLVRQLQAQNIKLEDAKIFTT